MADIQLLSGSGSVDLEFSFETPTDFFYIIEIIDDNRKQFFHDSGNSSGKIIFHLGPGNQLSGLYLKISWSAIDRAGAGNRFSAFATAIQNESKCISKQTFSGISNADMSHAQTIGKFL